MALVSKKYVFNRPTHETIPYTINVPFHNVMSICEHTLVANDILTAVTAAYAPADKMPQPGCGALYVLIGDGAHSPVFDASLKVSSASSAYDPTLGVVNLVSFLFTGTYYCYSITQIA